MNTAIVAFLYVVVGLIALKLRWVSEVRSALGGDQERRGIDRLISVLFWPGVVLAVWSVRRELKHDAKRMRDTSIAHQRKLELEWAASLPPQFQGKTIGELVWRQTGKSIAESMDAVLRIELNDDWTGLSSFAPIKRRFDLVQESGDWRCNGTLTFYCPDSSDESLSNAEIEGHTSLELMTDSLEILVEKCRIQRFIGSIDECPIERKVYVPYQERDDDRPHLKITIEIVDAKVVLYSDSQGDDHIPWALEFRGHKWVVDSAVPADAMKTLGVALKRQQFDNFLQDCIKQFRDAQEEFDRRFLREFRQTQD